MLLSQDVEGIVEVSDGEQMVHELAGCNGSRPREMTTATVDA
jgi:hypothetical protein